MQSPRYLCSQLVRLLGEGRAQWVNLEEIWREGAVLESEEGVAVGAIVKIAANKVTLEGQVTGAVWDETGWRIEVTFAESTPWLIEQWKPEHLFDPASIERGST